MIKKYLGAHPQETPVRPIPILHLHNDVALDPLEYPDPFQQELFAYDFKLHAVLKNNSCKELNGFNLHIYRQDGGLYDVFVYIDHDPAIAVFHKRRTMKDDSYTTVGPQIMGENSIQQLDAHMKYLDIVRMYPRPQESRKLD